MEELLKLAIGTLALILGIPTGNYLKEITKDEQKAGKIWFKILTTIGILGGFTGLIIREDWMMFTFFFIAIVTSRSLVYKRKKTKKQKLKSKK